MRLKQPTVRQEDQHKATGGNKEQKQEGSGRMEEENPLPVLAWKPCGVGERLQRYVKWGDKEEEG